MGNVPQRPTSVEELLAGVGHLSEAEQFDALHRHIAVAMGEADNFAEATTWVADAIQHLNEAARGVPAGGVQVSASALHLALGYIEYLEGKHIDAVQAGAA